MIITILIGMLMMLVLFDFVLHLFQSFGLFLIRFPSIIAYNIFWTTSWGVAFIILCFILVLNIRKYFTEKTK